MFLLVGFIHHSPKYCLTARDNVSNYFSCLNPKTRKLAILGFHLQASAFCAWIKECQKLLISDNVNITSFQHILHVGMTANLYTSRTLFFLKWAYRQIFPKGALFVILEPIDSTAPTLFDSFRIFGNVLRPTYLWALVSLLSKSMML